LKSTLTVQIKMLHTSRISILHKNIARRSFTSTSALWQQQYDVVVIGTWRMRSETVCLIISIWFDLKILIISYRWRSGWVCGFH
jgi:hypothetical protein